MGCSTCADGSAASPAGCQNNGTCGTSGCNKLNVYNWLSDMVLPQGHKPFNIVEVRFKGSRKEFYHNSDYIPLKSGVMVAVEASPGHDMGEISMVGELVRFQLKKKNIPEDSSEIRKLYRIAKPNEVERWKQLKEKEHETMHKSREIALSLKLKMKLSDVEYQGDGKKATFFYTADERVDFRELIIKMAEQFRVRIEMRQIGMRQEASRLGGIGSCGRELCCSTWLTDFKSVSTSAARYQNLSLNPLKLAGQCGKLKCCLNYELDSYLDALKNIPDSSYKLETERGVAFHRKTDIFRQMMWYSYAPVRGQSEEYVDMSDANNWIALPSERVQEIIQMNKAGKKPADLGNSFLKLEPEKTGYSDVVGQESLSRMMDKKGKKKRKKKRKNNKPAGQNPAGSK